MTFPITRPIPWGAGQRAELEPAEICMSCEFNDCAECEDWTEFGRCCCGELRAPAGVGVHT